MTILPESTIEKEIRGRELTALNWASELSAPVLMVWHKDKRLTQPLKDFMDAVRGLGVRSGMAK